MSTSIPDVFGRLRQPAYTGENRCIPCTITNVAISVVLAAVVWWGFALPAATVVFVVCLGAIYFRGYLVPGTPELTKRYFPDWLLAVFDTHESPTPVEGEDLDVEATLIEFGVLTECADVDDLCLDDAFRAAWLERIEAVREDDTGRDVLADLLDVDPDRLSFREYDSSDAFAATVDGNRVGQWESRAAFLADVGAAEVLESRIDRWNDLPVTNRSQLLGGLRLFLDTCPSCGGALGFGEDTVESCCRTIDVVAVTCEDCGARVFEAEYPDAV